ncbi:enoyl- hydratase domain-containing protein 1 [Nannochloropsis gaditana]|uniref:Enoyl-hydratase domain-containing protein 1 n=1 Tax=Nannochloropsis gaditana TaxID=72520 RepID=W7T610_9STRA|nr:enoyl- hydratase domain-containing protein 1 [Nannochloropsis gaditana]
MTPQALHCGLLLGRQVAFKRWCSGLSVATPSASRLRHLSSNAAFSKIVAALTPTACGKEENVDITAFQEKLRSAGDSSGYIELKRSDHDDRVLELIIKNPKSRNSLTGKMMMTLSDISRELNVPMENNKFKDCCALILSSEGTSFCAGADFHLASSIATPEEGVLMAELMTDTLTRLRRAPLISVAAIGGPAMGGGAELATSTDFRVMSPRAKMQFVQSRMGVSCGWGGTSRLVKLVGRQKTLHVLGTALPLDARTAKGMGLVDVVCDEEVDVQHAAWEFLVPFLRHTTESLRAIKYGVAAEDLTWDRAREVELGAFQTTWGSAANKHALATAKERIAADKKR